MQETQNLVFILINEIKIYQFMKMKIYITKLIISRIDNNNYEAKIVSQANNNVIKYRIIDKLISVPKLKTT